MKKLRVLSVVGARPQFIKASVISKELRKHHREILVHTGQHYDYEMSDSFFDSLGVPEPDENLGIGSCSHGRQTGEMLVGLERLILKHEPDWVLVYGDTNSTLAASLASAKINIPICHVEAGVRSYNRQMPEEINRVLTDRLSSLLLCPSESAARNLLKEGIERGVHVVGDVMADVLFEFIEGNVSEKTRVIQKYDVVPDRYLVVTAHRAENTDDENKLLSILSALSAVGEQHPVIFPMHPRTKEAIKRLGPIDEVSAFRRNVRVLPPIPYPEMIFLVQNAKALLTDSGGLQKESYWLETPCITLREETEWTETIDAGWNVLVGSNASRIIKAVDELNVPNAHPQLYGDGHTAKRCIHLLSEARA